MSKNKDKKVKIVFTIGVFDCLHQGHVKLFQNMRKHGEAVFALVHDDLSTFKNKGLFPIQDYNLREKNLLSSGLVDGVFPVNSADPANVIMKFISAVNHSAAQAYGVTPEITFVRGDDWRDFPGKKTVEFLGIPIVYHKYTKKISTTKRRAKASTRKSK